MSQKPNVQQPANNVVRGRGGDPLIHLHGRINQIDAIMHSLSNAFARGVLNDSEFNRQMNICANQLNDLYDATAKLMQQNLQSPLAQYAQFNEIKLPNALEAEDQFGEIVGYRGWRWDALQGKLISIHLTRCTWEPGEVIHADFAPEDYGQHGLHAWETPEQSRAYAVGNVNPTSPIVIGKVRLWGEVLCHEHGYRAEHARIISLDEAFGFHEKPSIWRSLSVTPDHYERQNEKALIMLRKLYRVGEQPTSVMDRKTPPPWTM